MDNFEAADQLARVFYELADAVDDFRTCNWDQLDDLAKASLQARVDLFTDRAHQYTAQALAAILLDVQPHLDNIKQASAEARNELRGLRDLEKGFVIIGALADLSEAIVTHNWGSVAARIDAVVEATKSDPQSQDGQSA
jgi:hypothetical protein